MNYAVVLIRDTIAKKVHIYRVSLHDKSVSVFTVDEFEGDLVLRGELVFCYPSSESVRTLKLINFEEQTFEIIFEQKTWPDRERKALDKLYDYVGMGFGCFSSPARAGVVSRVSIEVTWKTGLSSH